MTNASLSFAKIVATPTPISWSQAYNAGNLFVVVSLNSTKEENDSELTNIGKQVINNLEAEFFTLETKNLSSIKEAVLASLTDIPEYIALSLVLTYVKTQVLYVLLYGAGSILLKRGSSLGILLERNDSIHDIISASGYLKQGDLLLLRTKQFSDLIPYTTLKESLGLTLPSDIAEALSPHVHNTEAGGASAIIISVTGVPSSAHQSLTDEVESLKETTPSRQTIAKPPFPFSSKRFKFPNPLNRLPGNKKSLLLLIIAGILLLILVSGVFTAVQKRQEQKVQKNFTAVYSYTLEKYEQAIGIKTINPKRANEILQGAKKKLLEKLPQFPQNSPERRKLEKLQQKISAQISEPIQGRKITPEEVNAKESPLLQTLINDKNALSVTEDESFVYILSEKGISSIDKSNGGKKELITNEKDWEKATALGAYNGNFYVQDTEKGVIKFLVAENGYGKVDYFQENKPNLANAVSMSVDGSIWILSNNGAITKYTKGVQDQFTPKGLDTINKPVQITTNQDIENIYILDTGVGRIVQMQKDGVYKTSFRADILKNARAFTISSDEKTIYALSNEKVWKLPLR